MKTKSNDPAVSVIESQLAAQIEIANKQIDAQLKVAEMEYKSAESFRQDFKAMVTSGAIVLVELLKLNMEDQKEERITRRETDLIEKREEQAHEVRMQELKLKTALAASGRSDDDDDDDLPSYKENEKRQRS